MCGCQARRNAIILAPRDECWRTVWEFDDQSSVACKITAPRKRIASSRGTRMTTLVESVGPTFTCQARNGILNGMHIVANSGRDITTDKPPSRRLWVPL